MRRNRNNFGAMFFFYLINGVTLNADGFLPAPLGSPLELWLPVGNSWRLSGSGTQRSSSHPERGMENWVNRSRSKSLPPVTSKSNCYQKYQTQKNCMHFWLSTTTESQTHKKRRRKPERKGNSRQQGDFAEVIQFQLSDVSNLLLEVRLPGVQFQYLER